MRLRPCHMWHCARLVLWIVVRTALGPREPQDALLVPNQHWGPHQLSCPSAVSASGCWKDVPFPSSAAKIKDGIYLNPAMKDRIAENIKLFLPPGYDKKKNTHGISSVSPSYGIFKYQNPDPRVPNTWLSIKLMRFFFCLDVRSNTVEDPEACTHISRLLSHTDCSLAWIGRAAKEPNLKLK